MLRTLVSRLQLRDVVGTHFTLVFVAVILVLQLYLNFFYGTGIGYLVTAYLIGEKIINLTILDLATIIGLFMAIFCSLVPHLVFWSNLLRISLTPNSLFANSSRRKKRDFSVNNDDLNKRIIMENCDFSRQEKKRLEETQEETRFLSKLSDGILACSLIVYLLSHVNPAFAFFPKFESLPSNLVESGLQPFYSIFFNLIPFFVLLVPASYSFRDKSDDDYLYSPALAKIIRDEEDQEKTMSLNVLYGPPMNPPRGPVPNQPYKGELYDKSNLSLRDKN